MYSVQIGDINGNNTFLYYPSDRNLAIYDTSLELQVGTIGQFTFKVPVTNPAYNELAEFKIITILENDNEFWRGYIKEITTGFDKSIEVYCVEDIGWLNYEFLTPVSETVTKSQKLQSLITTYNSQTGVEDTVKTFEYGYVSSDISRKYQTGYGESIYENLVNLAGDNNYVRVRRENGNRYIDIVNIEAFGSASNQTIAFSHNLLDYTKELTTSYMLNVIYPYGAEIEGEEVYEGVPKRLVGTPVKNDESIAKYGRIAKSIFFDTNNAEILQTQAENYLNQNKNPRVALELSAVDMSQLGTVADNFKLGDKIHIIAEPFNIDMSIPVTALNMDLQDISKNTLTLSTTITRQSLTDQTTELNAELQNIPTTQSVMQSTRNNITKLLTSADGGYIVDVLNENGQRQQLWITDNIHKEDALKKWVWNENGLGYMHRPDTTTEEWTTEVALDIDGQIMARRGVIGSDSEAWDIGAHSIYNGTTSITDTDTDGLYIGTDGLLTVGTGTLQNKVFTRINGGKVYSNTIIEGASVKAGVLQFGSATGLDDDSTIYAKTVSGTNVTGTNGSFANLLVGRFVDGQGNARGYTGAYTAVSTEGSIRVSVVGGIITKVESL